MALTWGQKKAEMMNFIKTYYADTLLNEGFVSYKNEGFHWYKVKDDLLLTVRMPIFSPAKPVELVLGFGAIPLFSWEYIAPAGAYRDFCWDYFIGEDHFASVNYDVTYEAAQSVLGSLPRKSYAYTSICYYLPSGLQIMHLKTERCGAETLDEMILPVLRTFRSVEDVYAWNKQIKVKVYWKESKSEDELIDMLTSKYVATGKEVPGMTLAFADECIYCKDERFYPIVLSALEQYLIGRSDPTYRPIAKESIAEWEDNNAHARVLVEVIKNRDMALFAEESERVKAKMLAQIKKKLPDLSV